MFYPQELVADFLFVLCKENVNRLIKYTGYGNAAGLLASRGLMGSVQPQSNGDYSSDDEDSETEEYAMDKSHIDPMIGESSIIESSCYPTGSQSLGSYRCVFTVYGSYNNYRERVIL